MSTPHNQANMGEIAKTVLMPGDPLRAKFIAETFLENPVQFNSVRGMFGFTGTYKGKKVSVMGSGMGIPSIGIYSYELFKFYGVEKIIRIGSAGSYTNELNIYDVLLVEGAFSESTFALCQSGDTDKIQYPDPSLKEELRDAAKRLNIDVREGLVYSSDNFYFEENAIAANRANVAEYNLLACEMESFGLFHTAKILGKKAACLLTISDSLVTHEETTHEERQKKLIDMMKIALEAVQD